MPQTGNSPRVLRQGTNREPSSRWITAQPGKGPITAVSSGEPRSTLPAQGPVSDGRVLRESFAWHAPKHNYGDRGQIGAARGGVWGVTGQHRGVLG